MTLCKQQEKNALFEKIKAEDPELIATMSRVGQVAAPIPPAAKEIELDLLRH